MIYNNHGFALVAVALLLVVGSMALAAALVAGDAEATWRARLASKDRMEQLSQVLVRYQREHHRLPCPASFSTPQQDPLYGVETYGCSEGNAHTGTVRVVTASGIAIRIGSVPVRSLGLSAHAASDEWNHRLRYAVVEAATDPFRFSDHAGAMTVRDGSGVVRTALASYVLVSHGADGVGAFAALQGIGVAACAGASGGDVENCDDDGEFTAADIGATHNGAYDDAVVYGLADAQAQGTKRPCAPPLTPAPFTWGAGCSGPFTPALDSTTQTIANTAAGFTGNATSRCTDGTWLMQDGSCSIVPAASCSIPWGGSLAHGASITAYSHSSVACRIPPVHPKPARAIMGC